MISMEQQRESSSPRLVSHTSAQTSEGVLVQNFPSLRLSTSSSVGMECMAAKQCYHDACVWHQICCAHIACKGAYEPPTAHPCCLLLHAAACVSLQHPAAYCCLLPAWIIVCQSLSTSVPALLALVLPIHAGPHTPSPTTHHHSTHPTRQGPDPSPAQPYHPHSGYYQCSTFGRHHTIDDTTGPHLSPSHPFWCAEPQHNPWNNASRSCYSCIPHFKGILGASGVVHVSMQSPSCCGRDEDCMRV
jgi:hypothetical protein